MNSVIKISIAGFLLALAATLQAQTIVLQNINVVNVETLSIDFNQTVVISNQKIEAVLDSKRPRIVKNARVLDMTDKYLMPGLINSHVHHATVPDGTDNDKITRKRLRNLLRGGVTSVRDMGGDARALSSLQRRANADVIQSPDIYYSVILGGRGFFADPRTVASAKGRTPGSVDWMRAVDANSNFDDIMLRSLGTGATGIKIYADVKADVLEPLVLAATRHNLRVWSHVFIGPSTPLDAINAGVETVSHAADFSSQKLDDFYGFRREGKPLSEKQIAQSMELDSYQDLFRIMKRNDTILDATLTVFEQRRQNDDAKSQLMYSWSKMFTRAAHSNGIRISAGTDAASDMSGKSYPMVHHEMQLLVRDAGLKPLEAIRSATLVGAEVIGIDSQAGSVAAGKVANLVVLGSDPTGRIENTLDIAHVIKNGQFVHRGDLPGFPFSSAREAAGLLWMSGQLGNIPSTKVLASDTVEGQMTQAMKNFWPILQEYDLTYEDIVKCTLFLDDIEDWPAANEAYRPFFSKFPARSALATGGLALGAKLEVECIAEL